MRLTLGIPDAQVRQFRTVVVALDILGLRCVADSVGTWELAVQVIKAPTLLELSGPMFMSYPALNHLEVKLNEANGETKVTLRHRAVGMIDPQHREGVSTGWNGFLESVKGDFAKASESAA